MQNAFWQAGSDSRTKCFFKKKNQRENASKCSKIASKRFRLALAPKNTTSIFAQFAHFCVSGVQKGGRRWTRDVVGKAILGILCSALLSVAFHQSRVRPGPKWLRRSHFFKTDLSDCRWLGFHHVSHSQAVVLLLSLISATHAGLLGAGHLIFMMMMAMMKTIMKKTTTEQQ